jgi:hypothetical protein
MEWVGLTSLQWTVCITSERLWWQLASCVLASRMSFVFHSHTSPRDVYKYLTDVAFALKQDRKYKCSAGSSSLLRGKNVHRLKEEQGATENGDSDSIQVKIKHTIRLQTYILEFTVNFLDNSNIGRPPYATQYFSARFYCALITLHVSAPFGGHFQVVHKHKKYTQGSHYIFNGSVE